MRNLTNVLEGILRANFDISDADLPAGIIADTIKSGADYTAIYNKIVFELSSSMQQCPVSDTRGKSMDYTIVLLPKVNSLYPRIEIFTRKNSKLWAGIDIILANGQTKVTKSMRSIYTPPKNSRSYLAYLLPKDTVEELMKLA